LLLVSVFFPFIFDNSVCVCCVLCARARMTNVVRLLLFNRHMFTLPFQHFFFLLSPSLPPTVLLSLPLSLGILFLSFSLNLFLILSSVVYSTSSALPMPRPRGRRPRLAPIRQGIRSLVLRRLLLLLLLRLLLLLLTPRALQLLLLHQVRLLLLL